MKRVDRIDEKIIELYQNDARITNKAVANIIGVAPSTALERTRRLEELGVFTGYHASVNPSFLGIRLLAMIAVRLSKHDPNAVHRFQSHVMALPEVRDVYHVAGENDFLVHVAVRDSEHLRAVVLEGITAQEEVEHVETNLIFGHGRDPILQSAWEKRPF
ncbi:MAG: Lrp/AsnC family transcriptional regulator [Bacteroidetes Order II. Incertae sedis bacterium]|jgi:DNA-binding Lrp family transcriptional regulator|nr:Lrp/AsnC family transcriptional regulator [Bacteroidetes Order II. bacterium]MDG1754980.1 Lrp/AsnC family transcriptional regulator [Rhodothermales bacterium]HAY36355.1 ArsR family transcriptional regulator [Bacteroidota bacterium]MBT4051698.1 Lrp/AsnC family transcriptional regulator [Bacteroidetes Order II. bacterium]MBT4603253.1 Lrp/AsnC family transcriptional regulator [Bacteroidetes Order II. bacterium]